MSAESRKFSGYTDSNNTVLALYSFYFFFLEFVLLSRIVWYFDA